MNETRKEIVKRLTAASKAIADCERIIREEFDRAEREPTVPVNVVTKALEEGRKAVMPYDSDTYVRWAVDRVVNAIEANLKPTTQPPRPGERWRLKVAPYTLIDISQVSPATVFARLHPFDNSLTTLTASLDGFTDRWERVERINSE